MSDEDGLIQSVVSLSVQFLRLAARLRYFWLDALRGSSKLMWLIYAF